MRESTGEAIALPGRDDATLAADGLDADQVAERVAGGLTNYQPTPTSRSFWHILRTNLFTLLNTIVIGSAVLLLLLGQWQDALFGLAALGNALIGVVQEYRAKRALDRLALFNAPHARVLRAGEVREIAMADVVLDEVIVLHTGDLVPADAVVLHSEGLEIDESLLTGESAPAEKTVGDEVSSGSTVVAGKGNARVVRVGADSFASRLTVDVKRFSLVNSELRNSVNRVLRWISVALFPLIVIVINGQMQAAGGWAEAIASGAWRHASVGAIASVVAMIPLGLVLMTSIAFAAGAVRLGRQSVLVHELAAVEGLARVDVVCFDKTGTLTEGEIVFDSAHELETPAGSDWRQVLAWFAADDNANATTRSLRAVFPLAGELRASATVPFSSSRRWSAVSFDGGAAQGLWVLGSPDEVVGAQLAENRPAMQLAASLALTGHRTLVLAHSAQPMTAEQAAHDLLPDTLRPAVIVSLGEKLRPTAARTLAYLVEQGVVLRVLSGDDPHTVAAVARRAGLNWEGDGYDARNLPHDPQLLAAIMERYSVFGRVTPSQKKRMVIALQSSGHVVAMTGDGVNDAPAVKQADIGIAMGSGSAATRAVSRIVLLDSDFAHLPGIIREGRQVIANIERVSMLFLTKTAYAVLLSVVFGALLWEFPFLPRQLSASDGLTIGIPAFFLALMPNSRRYTPGFLRRSLTFAIPSGVTVALAVIAVNVYARATGRFSAGAVHTGSMIALSLVALWVLLILARPLDLRRAALVLAMYVGVAGVLIVPFIRDFFGFAVPPAPLFLMSLAAGAVGSVVVELVHRYLERRRPDDPGGAFWSH
ncbi:HAD-IC family P-type ATPase [Lacisediminihabitans sp.]|uniref:HAD-IC family P-type ATPase n=1 Tax=Lacisediminihabitans sp. TaxID=2787631 RepID=UPI00374D324C